MGTSDPGVGDIRSRHRYEAPVAYLELGSGDLSKVAMDSLVQVTLNEMSRRHPGAVKSNGKVASVEMDEARVCTEPDPAPVAVSGGSDPGEAAEELAGTIQRPPQRETSGLISFDVKAKKNGAQLYAVLFGAKISDDYATELIRENIVVRELQERVEVAQKGLPVVRDIMSAVIPGTVQQVLMQMQANGAQVQAMASDRGQDDDG